MNGLAKDIDYQAGNGYQDRGGRDDCTGSITDVGVFGLGLVRSDIEDVVLAQVEVGGEHQVALGQVEFLDFALAVGVFTDKFHVGTDPVYRHIARHGQGFQYVYLFVAHGEGTRTGYFTQYGNLVVGHADGHDGGFFQIGSQLFPDQVFGLVLGESAHLQTAQYRKVDFALVVHQVLLEGRLGSRIDVGQGRVQRGLYRQVERSGCLRVGGVYRDTQQILRHNLGIVQGDFLAVIVYCLDVLHVGDTLVGSTAAHQAGSQ